MPENQQVSINGLLLVCVLVMSVKCSVSELTCSKPVGIALSA
ncbi:hypothetical protein ACMVCI_002879 [Yersinia enterocolitica]|nr:hypothetical protein [Yersinia vastinensis]